MRTRAGWLAAVAVILGASIARADVTEYLAKPVASVRIDVEGRPAQDPTLSALIETPVGQPLSMASVRATISHLFSLGRYEDVRVHAGAAPGGVALVYELVPLHPVARIEFAGDMAAAGIDRNRLRRALVDRYGTAPPVGRAADMARLVDSEL